MYDKDIEKAIHNYGIDKINYYLKVKLLFKNSLHNKNDSLSPYYVFKNVTNSYEIYKSLMNISYGLLDYNKFINGRILATKYLIKQRLKLRYHDKYKNL